ncbi:MAG TPA: GH32 C-terminal domain-containing protein, partial [Isosphaeraceae bacterium]|nr:GH32 C-terminal domain-containing protein [Isosphaeraceae bacterium]
GEGVVHVYRAENEDLTEWKSLGVLFQHPDASVKNVECPLFFPLENRWVLIISQGRPVDWFVGDLDQKTMRFTPTARGKLDLGELYAPNVLMNDPKGRRILWGWANGFPAGRGWRHSLTLPRVLSIGADGTLRQAPAPELEALRGSFDGQEPHGQALELSARIPSGGVELLRGKDGQNGVRVSYDGQTLDVAGLRIPLKTDGPLDLRIFLDHSLLEVYANDGRVCVTRVVGARDRGDGIQWFGDDVKVEGAWPIGPIWKKP